MILKTSCSRNLQESKLVRIPRIIPRPQRMIKPSGRDRSNRYAYELFTGILLMTFGAQMMMEQQDTMLSTIGGTLSTLAEQAGLMGREIGEHNE